MLKSSSQQDLQQTTKKETNKNLIRFSSRSAIKTSIVWDSIPFCPAQWYCACRWSLIQMHNIVRRVLFVHSNTWNRFARFITLNDTRTWFTIHIPKCAFYCHIHIMSAHACMNYVLNWIERKQTSFISIFSCWISHIHKSVIFTRWRMIKSFEHFYLHIYPLIRLNLSRCISLHYGIDCILSWWDHFTPLALHWMLHIAIKYTP